MHHAPTPPPKSRSAASAWVITTLTIAAAFVVSSTFATDARNAHRDANEAIERANDAEDTLQALIADTIAQNADNTARLTPDGTLAALSPTPIEAAWQMRVNANDTRSAAAAKHLVLMARYISKERMQSAYRDEVEAILNHARTNELAATPTDHLGFRIMPALILDEANLYLEELWLLTQTWDDQARVGADLPMVYSDRAANAALSMQRPGSHIKRWQHIPLMDHLRLCIEQERYEDALTHEDETLNAALNVSSHSQPTHGLSFEATALIQLARAHTIDPAAAEQTLRAELASIYPTDERGAPVSSYMIPLSRPLVDALADVLALQDKHAQAREVQAWATAIERNNWQDKLTTHLPTWDAP